MNTPRQSVRLAPEERAELQRLAAEKGTTLSEAMRRGAWLYLAGVEGMNRAASYKPGRPRKEESKG